MMAWGLASLVLLSGMEIPAKASARALLRTTVQDDSRRLSLSTLSHMKFNVLQQEGSANATASMDYRIHSDQPSLSSPIKISRANKGGISEESVAAAASNSTGSSGAEQRIVGGQPVTAGEYPFFVHTDEANTACGGTLIHPDIVLTAASCLGLWTGEAIIGSIFYENLDDSETIAIESENPHPAFDENTFENDIMIVKLATPSPAPVIRVNTNNFLPFTGTGVTVIGFGATTEGGDVSLSLQEVDVETLDFTMCQDLLQGPLFPDTQMCAGELAGGLDRCAGDTGTYVLQYALEYVTKCFLTRFTN